MQYQRLKTIHKTDFNKVLQKGEEQVIVPYGNHVLGAMFLDYHHIIDEQLNNSFDTISRQIKGFYFGRYDLRCTGFDDLKQGKNISILELNGVGAEPAHIYQPGFSFFKAEKTLARHYKMMYEAATFNKKLGINYMTHKEFRRGRMLQKKFRLKATGK